MPSRSQDDEDPLNRLLGATKDTPAQRADAKKVSDEIDQYLKTERNRLNRVRANQIKLLLLGQGESGKSTILKQFALLYSVNSFSVERVSWRAIVYINLIASLRKLLDALAPNPSDGDDQGPEYDPTSSGSLLSSPPKDVVSHVPKLRRAFSPLFDLEESLIRKINSSDELYADSVPIPGQEVSVRSGAPWKKFFMRGKTRSIDGASTPVGWETRDSATHIITVFREDMLALWHDATVKRILRERRVRLEDESGFFLDDIERITDPNYLPSDDDILRARLKTVGVVEHTFTLEPIPLQQKNTEWKIYDVGGSRSQRYAWAPYFDDVDAVIFLAPLSAFDQMLAEDPTVNRLADSLQLWTELCSNLILATIPIVLFLNKCDLLQAKLEAGIKVKDYVTSYKDRPNDFDSVSKYFRKKFSAIRKQHSPPKRPVYTYFTSATNTKTVSTILASVRDTIYQMHLQSAALV